MTRSNPRAAISRLNDLFLRKISIFLPLGIFDATDIMQIAHEPRLLQKATL